MDAAIWRITAVAVLGSFMAQLDATVVNVSLATLAADLHSTLGAIQWVTSGYLLALALTLPLSGWLVDRIGAKALYLACFSAFTLSSAMCGLAGSTSALIGFRILQGMCGGLLAPMAQMMMARAAGRHMAQVVSLAAVPVLLAPLLGPVIAGVILQLASWRWLFLINLPIGILAVTLAALFLPNDREEKRRRSLDLFGLALLSPGLVLFLFGIDHMAEQAGRVSLIGSLILLPLFLIWALRRGDDALIDLRLFKRPAFAASSTVAFIINGTSFAGQMLIPIYLIRVCGRSPSATGLLLAPLGLGMMITYPWMGALSKRFGARRLAAAGAFAGLVGTLPFLYFSMEGLSLPLLIMALLVRGGGLSSVGIPTTTSAYASVPRGELPMATTALNIVQRIGGPTVTTLCATFLAWRLASAPPHTKGAGAFTAAFALLCAVHTLLLLATFRLPLWAHGKDDEAVRTARNEETRRQVS